MINESKTILTWFSAVIWTTNFDNFSSKFWKIFFRVFGDVQKREKVFEDESRPRIQPLQELNAAFLPDLFKNVHFQISILKLITLTNNCSNQSISQQNFSDHVLKMNLHHGCLQSHLYTSMVIKRPKRHDQFNSNLIH